MLGYRAPWVILLPALAWDILTLTLCFSAPAEERSWSWLNIWLFLIVALVIKAAFVTICLGEFQGALIPLR